MKIKILKDTPFHKANHIMVVEEFRQFYPIIDKDNSNEFLKIFLKSNYLEFQYWFELVEENKYKLGDWVWHDILKKAFIVSYFKLNLDPNEASLEAVNQYTDIWTRLATKSEIEDFTLHSFLDGRLLVGKKHCYYRNNDLWKEVVGIRKQLTYYMKVIKIFSPTSVTILDSANANFVPVPLGLKIGCQQITHDEILEMVYKLNIK